MHAHTHTVQLILKACRGPIIREGAPASHKTLSAHPGAGCVGDTQPLQSALPQQNCVLMQHHGKDLVAQCHSYFWVSAASLTKKASLTCPLLLSTAAGSEKGVSFPPCYQPARSEKAPLWQCHVFCDWQWIKFGENNCGSCCWPQVAPNIVWQMAEYGCSLVHCRVGATSLLSAFYLPSFPWWTICFGDTLG